MRTLQDHKVNPANDTLTIAVVDEPGAGGANHRYDIKGFDNSLNPSTPEFDEIVGGITILFQNGPLNTAGDEVAPARSKRGKKADATDVFVAAHGDSGAVLQ